MIITFTLSRVIKLVLISAKDPPRTNICELLIESIKIGMITGKPKMAIITALLLVLLEIEDTIVKALLNPMEPIIRFRKNGPEVFTGKPRNNENTERATVINNS